jgi:peptide-methionine (R)-S-oxide reductase
MNPKAVTQVAFLFLGSLSLPATTAFSTHRRISPSFTKCQASSNDNGNDNGNSNDKELQTEQDEPGTINPLRLAVLKLGLTELKWTSPLNYEKRVGVYSCANCGTILFDSKGKYDSGSGWPSFWKTADSNRVAYKKEWDGRVECSCKQCKGHLGHAFPDGPRRIDVAEDLLETVPDDDLNTSDPKNVYTRLPRYCMNGASLKFQER